MSWFKRKKNKEQDEKILNLLVEYIYETKRLGYKDEEIIIKLKNRGYPEEIYNEAFKMVNAFRPVNFKLNATEVKMQKEEYQDDEEEYEEEQEEQEEQEEPEEPKPQRTQKPVGRPKNLLQD